MLKIPCWSCGRLRANWKDDVCMGCWRIVCVTCAQQYGHGIERYEKQLKKIPAGAHARRKSHTR